MNLKISIMLFLHKKTIFCLGMQGTRTNCTQSSNWTEFYPIMSTCQKQQMTNHVIWLIIHTWQNHITWSITHCFPYSSSNITFFFLRNFWLENLATLICCGNKLERVFFDIFCLPEFESEVRLSQIFLDPQIPSWLALLVHDCSGILN